MDSGGLVRVMAVAALGAVWPGCAGSSSSPAAPRTSGSTRIAQRVEAGQLDDALAPHRDALADCLFASPSTTAQVVFLVAGNGRLVEVMVNDESDGALTHCIRGVLASVDFPRSVTLQTKGSFQMAR